MVRLPERNNKLSPKFIGPHYVLVINMRSMTQFSTSEILDSYRLKVTQASANTLWLLLTVIKKTTHTTHSCTLRARD